jgi:hypothetical protein
MVSAALQRILYLALRSLDENATRVAYSRYHRSICFVMLYYIKVIQNGRERREERRVKTNENRLLRTIDMTGYHTII